MRFPRLRQRNSRCCTGVFVDIGCGLRDMYFVDVTSFFYHPLRFARHISYALLCSLGDIQMTSGLHRERTSSRVWQTGTASHGHHRRLNMVKRQERT
ncbi:hypothetical protein IF1G_01470 [Cordyceps javanica]|uniref:Uncharacterized protein n=1 Tax=Cordyceps javanica TaxID=43265 RepID=A0A545VC07_9HYPO|nr:hypothetical protein IF1G_01470 [Cordyceps javanica]